MKLLQLNIWMGRLLPRVLELIEEETPDILCLQEVFSSKTDVVIPDFMFNSLEHIQNKTGFRHVYFSPVLETNISDTTTRFGNAIVSKYPLAKTETRFINGQFTANHSATDRAPNTRNIQYASIELPSGESLHLLNHHAYWLTDQLGDKVSVEKMKQVANFAQQFSGPLILSGDLNVTPESPAMRVFDDFLEDLTATRKLQTTLSELGKVKDVPCDHILVNSDIKVSDFRTMNKLASDHLALILEFDV